LPPVSSAGPTGFGHRRVATRPDARSSSPATKDTARQRPALLDGAPIPCRGGGILSSGLDGFLCGCRGSLDRLAASGEHLGQARLHPQGRLVLGIDGQRLDGEPVGTGLVAPLERDAGKPHQRGGRRPIAAAGALERRLGPVDEPEEKQPFAFKKEIARLGVDSPRP
jgi:hypothetical protein